MKRTAIALLLFGAMPFAYADSASPPTTFPPAAASVVASSATPDAQKSLGAYTEAYAPAVTALKTSTIDVSDQTQFSIGIDKGKGDIAANGPAYFDGKALSKIDLRSGGPTSTASTGVLTATAAPPLGFASEDLLAANSCMQTGTA